MTYGRCGHMSVAARAAAVPAAVGAVGSPDGEGMGKLEAVIQTRICTVRQNVDVVFASGVSLRLLRERMVWIQTPTLSLYKVFNRGCFFREEMQEAIERIKLWKENSFDKKIMKSLVSFINRISTNKTEKTSRRNPYSTNSRIKSTTTCGCDRKGEWLVSIILVVSIPSSFTFFFWNLRGSALSWAQIRYADGMWLYAS